MKLTRLTTDHLRVPLGRPARLPLADLPLAEPPPTAGPEALDLVLVHLETDAGLTGLGFAALTGPGGAAVRSLIDTELSPRLVGEDPRDTDRLLARAEGYFRPVGFAGPAARAYSALDVGFWDLKAKAAGLPLYRLLGNARPAAPFFVSDLSGDGVRAAELLRQRGAFGVRIEIGGGDVQADADHVRAVAEGLGDDAWVAVSAGGRLDLSTARALAHFFQDLGIDRFEDPIPSADEPGYATLAAHTEIPLAVGAGFSHREAFFRVIRLGHVRTIRPDVGRLGGITPVLKVAAVAEAFHVAVSPVRLPEIGVHLACGLGVVTHVDSVSWLREVFVGGPRQEGGKLLPPDEPGLGLSLNPEAVPRFGRR